MHLHLKFHRIILTEQQIFVALCKRRKVAAPYAEGTKKLFLELMEAVVESLGLSSPPEQDDEEHREDDIMEQFKEGSQLMVLNCYPPCPEPDLTLGMPPHSDYGFLTLLLQDQVQGLQILHHEDWVTIEPIHGALIVNVGDHLEVRLPHINIVLNFS